MNKVNNKQKLLSLVDISKSFQDAGDRIDVLKSLNLDVLESDFIAIKGASGIGKSTLLHIMGLLDTPSSGRVKFAGEDVGNLSDAKMSRIRNNEIGFAFQFHHLLPDFTAWENVMMPGRIAGLKKHQNEPYCRELMEMVKMDHRLKHLPSELSGGERQRVALARALVQKPRLLLADEPSGNLDEENKKILNTLLADVHSNINVTIVLVTHDISLSETAEKQFLMRDGIISQET